MNRRDRTTIMEDIRARIDRGDVALERKEAIKVCSWLCKVSRYILMIN